MTFLQSRAKMVDAVFARLGEAASWSGMAEPVRVILREGDEIAGTDQPGLVMATHFVRVRRSEVADPADGDLVETQESGGVWRVTGDPRIDRKGVWHCEVLAA